MSHMIDEIEQQPEVLERTFRAEAPLIEELRRRLESRPPRMVVLIARGTSDNAALFGRYLIEITTGIPVSLAAPSVATIYGSTLDWRDALVVGVSQSGESTDVNLCLEAARESGSITLGITNESGSAMTRIAEAVCQVHGGREVSVAATKTYTGQLLVFYLLAYALGAALPLDAVRALPEAASKALKLKPRVAEISERYRYMDYAVAIGRGLNYATAFEFALKMMETCYVVAERFSGADFAHGPIALVEHAFPVFLFAPAGPTYPGSLEMAQKLAELGAERIIFAPASDSKILGLGTRSIGLPETPAARPADLFTPIPYIIPAQLFAAFLARHKGLDPDRPRGLSKVTKTI